MSKKEKILAQTPKLQATSYVSSIYKRTSDVLPPRANNLKQVAFKDMVEDISNAKKVLNSSPYVKTKLTKGDNGLPLVSSLMQEVGVYGLIFAGGLQYSQYYKKTSPQPRRF